MRRYLMVLLGVAVLAAGCGDDGAATTQGTGTSAPTVEQIRPVTITGTPLPTLPEEGNDPAVGMLMPEMVGSSFDGTEVSITNDGRPKVLLFLAHW